MKSLSVVIMLLSLALGSIANGQQTPRPGEDLIGNNFFSPDLIMNHQPEVGLTDAQLKAIKEEMKKMQSFLVDVQFNMTAATQEFINTLNITKIDENKAIAAYRKLTKIEDEMKVMHITTMIRIKNSLTKEQQEKLKKLK